MKIVAEVSNVRIPDVPKVASARMPVRVMCDLYEEGNTHQVTLCMPRWVANRLIDALREELGS